MANQQSGGQGAGKHPHKSTEEPHPHTREQGAQQGGQHSASAGSGGGRSQASHAGGGGQSGSSHSGGGQGSGGHVSGSHSGSAGKSDDLKEREDRDKDGNIHHHTRTSGASQGGKKE